MIRTIGIIMLLHEGKSNIIYVAQESTSSRGQHKRYSATEHKFPVSHTYFTSAHAITEFGTTVMEHIVEYYKPLR